MAETLEKTELESAQEPILPGISLATKVSRG
jgi:hypothetical protein